MNNDEFDAFFRGVFANMHATLPGECNLGDVQIKHKEERINMNYEELTCALPLLGMRVMINPKYYDKYNEELRGISGTITNLYGAVHDANNSIRNFKQKGKISWEVSVQMDNGTNVAIYVSRLLPIHNTNSIVYQVKFKHESTYTWTESEYEKNLDDYVIQYAYTIENITKWDNEKRKETFDSL